MSKYPVSTAQAQRLAAEIAAQYGNLECTECCRAIVKAIGPGIDAEIVKLRVQARHGGAVYMPSEGIRVSQSGQHVGVRIGDRVYDNLNHGGIDLDRWMALFVDGEERTLNATTRPIAEFFGRIFRGREFRDFASSRVQHEFLEDE